MEGFLQKLKGLDAYPKVNEDFYKRTLSGGVVTVVASVVMLLLFVSETRKCVCAKQPPPRGCCVLFAYSPIRGRNGSMWFGIRGVGSCQQDQSRISSCRWGWGFRVRFEFNDAVGVFLLLLLLHA